MKLSTALLCVECEELYTTDVLQVDKAEGRRIPGCPSCGCTAFMRISRIIVPMGISNDVMQEIGTRYMQNQYSPQLSSRSS